jgi:hypothetical protein
VFSDEDKADIPAEDEAETTNVEHASIESLIDALELTVAMFKIIIATGAPVRMEQHHEHFDVLTERANEDAHLEDIRFDDLAARIAKGTAKLRVPYDRVQNREKYFKALLRCGFVLETEVSRCLGHHFILQSDSFVDELLMVCRRLVGVKYPLPEWNGLQTQAERIKKVEWTAVGADAEQWVEQLGLHDLEDVPKDALKRVDGIKKRGGTKRRRSGARQRPTGDEDAEDMSGEDQGAQPEVTSSDAGDDRGAASEATDGAQRKKKRRVGSDASSAEPTRDSTARTSARKLKKASAMRKRLLALAGEDINDE